MMKNQVLSSTLEEDLKALGLAHESEKPPASAPEAKTESAPPAGTPAATPPVTTETPPAGTGSDALAERRNRMQVRVSGGKAKRVRTKRTSMAKKLANRGYYRKKKNVIKRRKD